MSQKTSNTIAVIALYLFYIAVAAFFLLPIIWVLSLSLKTVPELYRMPPSLLPDSFMLDNYKYVVIQVRLLTGVWNSLKITLGTIVGTLVISIPAAYCFSRMKFKLSKQLQFIILMFQMISPLVVVVPIYRYFGMMNLLNSHTGLICIYIATSAPFQVWFLKSFIDTIPKELDEAATIDGCNRLQTVIRMILPVIAPGIFSAVLLIFILSWSQFVIPYILIDTPSKMPIAVQLVNLQSTLSQITTHYLAAASIVAILPTIILFVFLQKYIVAALTAGAVKG